MVQTKFLKLLIKTYVDLVDTATRPVRSHMAKSSMQGLERRIRNKLKNIETEEEAHEALEALLEAYTGVNSIKAEPGDTAYLLAQSTKFLDKEIKKVMVWV